MVYQQIYDFLMQSVFNGVNNPPVEWVEMLSTVLSSTVVLIPFAVMIGLCGWLLKGLVRW